MTAAHDRANRVAAINALNLKPGDVVNSVYGNRKILKVNAKSVILEAGSPKGLLLEKHLIIRLTSRAS